MAWIVTQDNIEFCIEFHTLEGFEVDNTMAPTLASRYLAAQDNQTRTAVFEVRMPIVRLQLGAIGRRQPVDRARTSRCLLGQYDNIPYLVSSAAINVTPPPTITTHARITTTHHHHRHNHHGNEDNKYSKDSKDNKDNKSIRAPALLHNHAACPAVGVVFCWPTVCSRPIFAGACGPLGRY